MEHLRCVIERITYQNAENGYTVLKCAVKNSSDLVTVVGTMPETHVGSVLSLEGWWKVDAKYGRQFSVEKFEETLPATVYGIEKYLGSGLIKGVGPKFAKRIVEKFGKDTLDVIEESPDDLLQIQGIGKVRVDRIKTSWQEQKEIKNIMLFLQSYEVSTAHATKIFKTYGSESIAIVKDNPYRLADDIWGIGFKTADEIARKMGIGKERFVRLRSGIFYSLNKLAEDGHCYAKRKQLIEKAKELLEVEEPELEFTLDEMLRTNDLIREQTEEIEAIYLPPYYFSESGCARKLIHLLSCQRTMKEETEKILEKVAANSKITYDEIQWQAVKTAISSKVMVLTGGPGTGKTTTTLGIISAYRQAGCQIVLAAPTGRAAKRLSEATGMEAKTIHRLLEFKPPEGYQKNEENPLKGDVLILDECSMIDVMLMYNLLKAIPEEMSLILVGDIDQLPSVGAGNVLRDIIDSERVPVVRLTRIFRQAQGSRIIMNAHRINKGEKVDLRGGKDSDFFFATQESNQDVIDTILRYCKTNLPKYYHVDPLQDIQVLTPMQRGECGAVNLNQVLQEAMNPSRIFLRRGGNQYRLNDKVMQIRNDYDKEVFNGDIGRISKVDMEERELTVLFDDREVVYDVTELDELVLAYAITIHKSQGSEYPIVVMPLTMSHFVMLQRNLLYTGVTRAKKILVLVGEKRALYYAIKNETSSIRNTLLASRLRAGSKESKETGAFQLRFGSIAAFYYEIKGEKLPNQMELLDCFFPGLIIKRDSSDGNTKVPAEYVDQECIIHAVRYKGKLYAGESKRVSQILGRLIGMAKGNQEKERKSAELIQKHVAQCFVEDMELTPRLQENIQHLLESFSDEQKNSLRQKLMKLLSVLPVLRSNMTEEEKKGELFALDDEVFDDILYNAAYQLNLNSYSGLCNAYLWFLTGGLLRNETGRVLRHYDSYFIAVYRQPSETNQLEDKLNYLFHPEEYEDFYTGDDLEKRFPGIEWYCDNCETHLNEQEGFDDHLPYWKCSKCGYYNRLEIDEIYENSGNFKKEFRRIDPVKFADALERRRLELEEERKRKESFEENEEK